MKDVVKDASSLLKELTGSGFSGPEKLILENGTKIQEYGPNCMAKWLNDMSKSIICSAKYQNIIKNRTESQIMKEVSELIIQFCSEIHTGKSILEAMKHLKINPELLIEEFFEEPKIKQRIQKAKLRTKMPENETNTSLLSEYFMDRVYLAFYNLMIGLFLSNYLEKSHKISHMV